MTAPPPPPILASLDGPWTLVRQERDVTGTRLDVTGPDGSPVRVRLERCLAGRLRGAYPAGARDLELRVESGRPLALGPLLRAVITAVRAADPLCRRVVHATAAGDRHGHDQARRAGLRLAADVDLGDEPFDLFVAEPGWVTGTDADLDRVPGA